MDPDEVAERFAQCRISHADWTHQAHLVVGLWHVHRFGAEKALELLRQGIRRLNDSHGTPNSVTRGYHETITRAYVLLLAQFLAAGRADAPLRERTAELLAGPLADKDALLRFYSRERLMSPEARAEWVAPDIAGADLSVG